MPASVMAQSRAVLSWLLVSTILPSGLNAAAVTAPVCSNGSRIGWPVAAFQSRAVLSWLLVSTILPSGLNATAVTAPVCSNGRPMGVAVETFQSRAVLSWLPVIAVLPLGLNATAETAPLCASVGPMKALLAVSPQRSRPRSQESRAVLSSPRCEVRSCRRGGTPRPEPRQWRKPP